MKFEIEYGKSSSKFREQADELAEKIGCEIGQGKTVVHLDEKSETESTKDFLELWQLVSKWKTAHLTWSKQPDASPSEIVEHLSYEVYSKKLPVFLDTETTGLSPKSERIIEIAIIEYDPVSKNANPLINTLVNPGRKIPSEASSIHNIFDKDLEGAPYFSELYPEICKILEDRIIIGHNISFDLRFLEEEFIKVDLGARGLAHRIPSICTLSLLKQRRISTIDNELKSTRRLDEIFPHEIKGLKNHSALADSIKVATLYYWLKDHVYGFEDQLEFFSHISCKLNSPSRLFRAKGSSPSFKPKPRGTLEADSFCLKMTSEIIEKYFFLMLFNESNKDEFLAEVPLRTKEFLSFSRQTDPTSVKGQLSQDSGKQEDQPQEEVDESRRNCLGCIGFLLLISVLGSLGESKQKN